MISKEGIATIEQEAQTLFKILGEQGDFTTEVKEDEHTIAIALKIEDPKLFIGEKGQTLFEIQHLLKLIVRKKLPETAEYYTSLDINEYKKNKEEYLRDLAITTADEVALLKKSKELPAMLPGERRIVHAALNSRNDVVSESIGEEPDRKIVIKLQS